MDYSFVPELGSLDPARLAGLRRQAIRGSHLEAILQEALLDREYDLAAARQSLQCVGSDFVLNSFAGQEFAGVNLTVRSEFLILRGVGAGQLTPQAQQALCAEMYVRMRELHCPALMYRLCDYNPDEQSFLASTAVMSRGAQRLIDAPDLLEYDLRMVEAALSAGVLVDVLIPFVQFSEQLGELLGRIRHWFESRSLRPRRIGCMLELPANLFEIERFAVADYFVFGPGDLLRFSHGGLERTDPLFERARMQILDKPIRDALAVIDSMGGRCIYLAKKLGDLADAWDLAQFSHTHIGKLIVPSQLVPLARPESQKRPEVRATLAC